MPIFHPIVVGLFTLLMFDQGWKLREASEKSETVKAVLLFFITVLNIENFSLAVLTFSIYYIARLVFYPTFRRSDDTKKSVVPVLESKPLGGSSN